MFYRLTVDKSPPISRRNSVKSVGSSYHSSDDSLSSDYSRSRSRSASRSRRSRSRTRSRSRSRSRTRSRSRYRTRSRSQSRSYRSRSRSLPYDRSTKSRSRSPSVSSPDSEDWENRPDDGFYARMPEVSVALSSSKVYIQFINVQNVKVNTEGFLSNIEKLDSMQKLKKRNECVPNTRDRNYLWSSLVYTRMMVLHY